MSSNLNVVDYDPLNPLSSLPPRKPHNSSSYLDKKSNNSINLPIGYYDPLDPLASLTPQQLARAERRNHSLPKQVSYNNTIPYDPLRPLDSLPIKNKSPMTNETNIQQKKTEIQLVSSNAKKKSFPWTIVLIIILIILVISYVLIYFLYPQSTSNAPLPASVSALIYQVNHETLWDDANQKPVSGVQGTCQFYNSTVYDYATLSKLQPLSRTFNCLDYDLVYAKEVTHKCGSTSTTNTNKYPCIKQDGTTAKVGDIESFFKPCNLKLCDQQPSYVMFNNLNTSLCLTMPDLLADGSTRSNNIVTLQTCGGSNKNNQLFRLSRADWGGTPSTSGPLVKIQDRLTGLCLKSNFLLGSCSAFYDFIYYDGSKIPGKGDKCTGDTKSCPSDSSTNVDCTVAGPQQLVLNLSDLTANPFINTSNPICIVSKFNVLAANGTSLTSSPFIYDTSCTSTSSDTSVCDAKFVDQKNKTITLVPEDTLSLIEYAKSITPVH
jgi:hypothetical protein